MSWHEDRPQDTDRVTDWAATLRARKVDVRSALSKHFYFQEHSGTSAGIPRLSTTTPGSARAFFGLASQVSAYRDGALFVTSDTSRFYGLTSTSSFLLGGRDVVVFNSPAAGETADQRYISQISFARGLGKGSYTTNWGTPFAEVPRVVLSQEVNVYTNFYTVSLSSVSAGGFSFGLGYLGTGADPSNCTIHWLASGLSAFGAAAVA